MNHTLNWKFAYFGTKKLQHDNFTENVEEIRRDLAIALKIYA